MGGRIEGERILCNYARELLKHERFEPLRHCILRFKWELIRDEYWGYCWLDGTDSFDIRINKLIQTLGASDLIIQYLVCHEMIHALPNCEAHNDTFWDHEITIMGEDYYTATIWLRRHKGQVERSYYYKKESWLRKMISIDQLRIKDMATICECSETTIKRWLRKYNLYIKKR